MKKKLSYVIISIVVLAADQLTKVWASVSLKPVVLMEIVPGFFRFSYATNRGVAFSLLADSQFEVRWILAAISLVAALFVIGYFRRTPPERRRLNASLSLLLAGIAGNMIDRVRLGEVVDFIELHWRDVYSWPTFNLADSAICAGAALLALEMLREEKAAKMQASISASVAEESGVTSSEN